MNLEERQFELEKQLHDQYAINNNERMSSLITLFVSLIAVLGAYGYMFLHTASKSALDLGDIYLGNDTYTIDALLLTAAVCYIVIAIMQHLCIYQGAYQRKEQFIIHTIRIKNEMDMSIFPEGYTPFGKTRKDFVQGIYGELVKIFDYVEVMMLITTFWKYFETKINVKSISFECLVFFVVCFCLSFLHVQIYSLKCFYKYKELESKKYV